MLNCLAPQTACQATLEMLAAEHNNRYVIDAMCQKLTADITTDGWRDCHDELYKQLLALFDSLETREKRWYAYVLGKLAALELTPQTYRYEILHRLLLTDQDWIRSYAYNTLRSAPVEPVLSAIESAWQTYGDVLCGRIIAKRCPIDLLERQFTSLWAMQDERITIPLLLKVELTAKRLANLRKIDGITFAYICAKRGRILSDEEARALWRRYAMDKRAGLLLWCFGQMKLMHILTGLELSKKQRLAMTLSAD